MKKQINLVVLFGLLFAIFIFFLLKLQSPSTLQKDLHKVTYVIDGDTIIVDGKTTVRYIGINTPEIPNKHSRKIDCFGQDAFQKNKSLVLGQSVALVKDKSETDKYGRLLRYVYVDNIFINDYLVLNGYARTEPVKPDIKYAETFYKDEQEAKAKNTGLWMECARK